jgi:ABC-2 type transport system permease protein
MTTSAPEMNAPATGGKRPSVASIGWARVVLETRLFFRGRQQVVFTFLLPIMLLIIFGSVFNNTHLAGGVTFAQYFTAGMIASGMVYTAFQNLAIVIPQERQDGTLRRLGGMPVPKVAYFIGKGGQVLAAYVGQVFLLLLVGRLFFHLKLPATGAQWWTFVWVSIMGLACWTLLGIAFSVVPKNAKSASAVVSPIVLVLQFISGVFFVFAQLPTWMQKLASIFPLKWMTQGMRSVFLPDAFKTQEVAGHWQLGSVALMLGIWIVIGLVCSIVFFRWIPKSQR